MLGLLDDIDTGYEGKFDFPRRHEPPAFTYLLAATPRAGSSLFSHILWQCGCLGAPLEYLNFDPLGPYSFAARSPDLQHQLWRSVLRGRTSPNGVFGLKVFPMQLQELRKPNPALLADVLATMLPPDKPARIVYLRRRDRVAQSVSYARATLTGIWRKEQELGSAVPPPAYSQEALESAERGILAQQAVWERMFDELGIAPLEIWHEDVLADRQAAVRSVAGYVGVAVDPEATIAIPEIQRQSRGDGDQWAQRYASSGRLG